MQATPNATSEETLEARIARLKRELLEAEAELESREEAALVAMAPDAGALVWIGTQGAGCIAEMRGRIFLITSIDVLGAARAASIRTEAGEVLELPENGFVSQERGLVIVPIDWDGPTLSISQSLRFDEVDVGQAVTIPSESDDLGMKGVIQSVESDALEVFGRFASGQPGAPIIQDHLGKVIGIASTYEKRAMPTALRSNFDFTARGSQTTEVRCLGDRLDGEITWVQVALSDLYNQGEIFARYEDRTTAISRIGSKLMQKDKLLTEYSDHDSLGFLYDNFERDFAWHRGKNASNNQRMMRQFVTRMLTELQTDRASTQDALTIEYYQRRFVPLEAKRDQAAKDFLLFRSTRLD
jgi:hypothetical protein